MPNLRFLYSKLSLHWGFTVRVKGATAAQPALVLPPPTTVIGTFAHPLARLLGLQEEYVPVAKKAKEKAVITPIFECFLRSARGATAGLDPESATGLSTHMETTRIMGLVYKTGGQVREALKRPIYSATPVIMPVQPLGSTYAPNGILHIGALIDIGDLAKCLGTSVQDIDAHGLKACYGVSRLGSKEGLVSVLGAAYGEPESSEGDISTIGYVPASMAIKRASEFFVSIYMYDLEYRMAEYLVPVGIRIASQNIITPPVRLPGANLTLNPGFKAYYLNECEDLKVVASVK